MTAVTRAYRLGNDLERITEVVGDILSLVRPLFSDAGQIEVALYEAIYNAIEHGNLALSFSDKKKLIESGRYDRFIAERRAEQPYAGRSVGISLQLDERSLSITVTDEGTGFDWRACLSRKEDEAALLGVNGRGIRIMQSAFDDVRYNDTGNIVTLSKNRERA